MEDKIRDLRKVIVECIQSPLVVVRLVSLGAISQEVGERLKKLYETDNTMTSREMLDSLYRSQEPGKWTSFMQALQSEGYPHLTNLIEGKDWQDVSHLHAKEMIKIFTPDLCRLLLCGDLVSLLLREETLLTEDEAEIMGTLERKGNTYAMLTLLQLVQTRVSPSKWYYDILNVLVETENESVVQMLEPEFLTNPSKFMPKLGPIVGTHVIRNVFEEEDEVHSKQTNGSTRQIVDSCYEEGEIYSNDLADPPSPLDRPHVVSALKTGSPLDGDSITQVKQLNINLDVMYNLNDLSITRNKDGQYNSKTFVDESVDDTSSSCITQSDDSDIDDSFEGYSLLSDDENVGNDQTSRSTFKLYNYQLELAENALLGRNTIICAETGTGKTFVAFHVIREHLKKGEDKRKIVFMARTVLLVKQQFQRFQKYMPEYSAKLLTGEVEECRMLHMFMNEPYHIIFMTPQILVNSLDDKTVKDLSEFSMLFLDECHHTRANEPFRRLMRRYLLQKYDGSKNLPQIVGLTASIGVGKSRNEVEAEDYILNICACLDVELLSTVERCKEELKAKTNKPVEEMISLHEFEYDPCREAIIGAMEETEQLLNGKVCMEPNLIEMVHNKRPTDKESQKYTKWAIEIMDEAERKVKNKVVGREIRTCGKYLYVYNSALEINRLLTSGDVIKFLAGSHKKDHDSADKLTEFEKKLLKNLQDLQMTLMTKGRQRENPNVRILSYCIRQTIEQKGEDSRAMVFVKARATCRALAEFLNRDLECIAVRASPLLGQGERGGDEGMTGQEQQGVLHKFETGIYTILVCTSIGNEGIDVPKCNIVISYDYSGNEITRIQMTGRARHADAKSIALGSALTLARERNNAYKAFMMYRAMNVIQNMDPKVLRRRILVLQQNEVDLYRYKVETVKMKERRKTDEDYPLHCRHCSAFLCNTSDLRKYYCHYIVIRNDFRYKIEKIPHRRPKEFDGLKKKYKMQCKQCPNEVGCVFLKDVWECYALSMKDMKVFNWRRNEMETYKTWIDSPCKVQKIKTEDLPRLLGDQV